MAAGHDEVSLHFRDWLRQAVENLGCDFQLFDDRASSLELREALDGRAEGRVLLVFFGHGSENYLLVGPPGRGRARFEGLDVVADLELLVQNSPLEVVAFCCSSAKGLGSALRLHNSRNRFLGYLGDWPVPLGAGVIDAIRAPALAAAGALRAGGVDGAAVGLVLDACRTEHRRWSVGEKREHPDGVFVQMALEEHARKLDRRV